MGVDILTDMARWEVATYRCYNELRKCDKTHDLIVSTAKGCYKVASENDRFVLIPDIDVLADHIDDLLFDVFKWENLTESSYAILRKIGDYRQINFHQIAAQYFKAHVPIIIPSPVAEVA